jgi:hypothetical protein
MPVRSTLPPEVSMKPPLPPAVPARADSVPCARRLLSASRRMLPPLPVVEALSASTDSPGVTASMPPVLSLVRVEACRRTSPPAPAPRASASVPAAPASPPA